ncbi:MAG: universal stress protein [Actinobacteria bacterium]|nr:universal stress protein [Actinomycetota bacterium]
MSADDTSGQIREIVVGISEAPTSQVAARRAVELAALAGARVHFVTAVERVTQERVGVATDVFVFDSLDLGRESVEKFVRSIDPDIEYTVTAVEGPPARVLLEVAEQVKADLIVVGNVRMQGLGRVLGSVGNEVLRSAPCSVLIVKTV